MTTENNMSITLEEFRIFREYFYRKTGMYFEDSKRYFVDKRIEKRIEATDSLNFRDYFNGLRFEQHDMEFQNITNLMTINETYFFREEYQFQALVNSLLDDIVARKPKGRPIRIWSLPSSTGEEPYSIAIYLIERWSGINDFDIEIIGSDIDSAVIDSARKGVFSKRSIQNLPENILKKYFTTLAPDKYQICDDLRDSVEFTKINIHDSEAVKAFRYVDIVFCRNLLIYFDEVSRRKAAQSLFDVLNPGGFICLGHSESMSRISSLFQIRKFPEAIVYQKPIV